MIVSVYVLAALLIITNVFWAYVCHKVVNKLMSRSFYEYKSAELQEKKLKVESRPPSVNENDFEDFGPVSEIMN